MKEKLDPYFDSIMEKKSNNICNLSCRKMKRYIHSYEIYMMVFRLKKNRIYPNPTRKNQNPNLKYQPEFDSQQKMKDKTIRCNSAYKSNREKLDYSTDAVFYLKCTAQRPILQITLLYMQNHSFEVLKM